MTRISYFRQSVLGWMYPPVCASCEDVLSAQQQLEMPFLCEACEGSLERIGKSYCPVCGQTYEAPTPGNMRCGNCGDRELAIDFAVSAYRSSGKARQIMHQFKYGKQQHLARLMGGLIQRVWEDSRLHKEAWWVVPVPLHPRRMRSRGFNQSEEIARQLVRLAPSGVQLQTLLGLKRARNTVRQAQLDRRDRLRNLIQAFEPARVLQKVRKGPSRVILVDDVITTGTTVSECAAVLRLEGDVEEIAAVSVLRG
ncbi:MAG: hypothetical protein CMO55_24375 [Verrucomicrobiales bacterium]|nr:hypothetical protein [Verrucomicrobiales bacterium]